MAATQPPRPHSAAYTRFRFDCGDRQKEKSLAGDEALRGDSAVADWVDDGDNPPTTHT